MEIFGQQGSMISTRDLPDGVVTGANNLFLRDLDQNALILFGGYYRKIYGKDIDYDKFHEFFDEQVLKQLFCKGCGVYLGFKIDASGISLDAQQRMKEDSFPLDLAPLEGGKDLESLQNLYTLLGRYSQAYYFAESYMYWFDPEKESAQWKFLETSELRCKTVKPFGRKQKLMQCDALLGTTRDVICKDCHTHDCGNGEEPTLYLSKIVEENVELGKKQATYLSVGPMYYRDLKCTTCNEVSLCWMLGGLDVSDSN